MQGVNSTFVGHSWQLEFKDIPLLFLCFVGVVSHSLLLYAFYKDPLKCFKRSGTFLVINLAIADSLMCLVSVFYICLKEIFWHDILKPIVFAAKFVSILTLSSISIDRFLLVAYPIKHSYLIKGTPLVIWPACIWLIGIVFPMKRVIFGQYSYDLAVVNSTTAIIGVFSAVMYALTYSKLKKQSRNIQALQSSNESCAQRIRVLKEKQILRTIVIIACIAVICIVPFSSLRTVLPRRRIPILANILSDCMLYINFAVNPLIYILRLPNYRKTFVLLYCGRR